MTIMPFGKYTEGPNQREVDACPSDYLQWLLEQEWFEDKWPELKEEVAGVMDEREVQGTHWDKWEEELGLDSVRNDDGERFI